MNDPLFLIEVPLSDEDAYKTYITENWKMVMRQDESEPERLTLVGQFYDRTAGVWIKELRTDSFSVYLVTSDGIKTAYQNACDLERIKHWADTLKGLAETFFDSKLPLEVRDILKRSPDAVGDVSKLVGEGLNSLLKKFGK